MKKGDILYNIEGMQDNEQIKVYSKSEDIYGNEKIDIYKIEKKNNSIFIIYEKRTGLDNDRIYFYKEKVKRIGVSAYVVDRWKIMNLSKSEMISLKKNSFEHSIIRMGYALEGEYESGLEFMFNNILLVTMEI